MSDRALPHDPYITAVVRALAAGLEPDGWWTSDAEVDRYDTGPDTGCTTMLDAHLAWVHSSGPHEHGIHLVWEHPAEQWQWAPRKGSGVLAHDPEFLPTLGRYADPAAVVAVVRALLAGEQLPEGRAPYWHEADAVKRAVAAWAADDS